jgi:hypothetical protein
MIANAPLAMITFHAVARGRAALAPVLVQITGASGVETGSCSPTVDLEMRCAGAVVTVSDEAQTATAEAAQPPGDVGGGSGFPALQVGLAAGFVALFLAGVVLWFRLRPRGTA